jgi:hypothetical protein
VRLPAPARSAQPKPAPLPVEVDTRLRQGFLPCRHPSRVCSIEPPLSYRARNKRRAARSAETCGKPRTFGITKARLAVLPVSPTAIPGLAAAVEEARTERPHGRARITGTAGCYIAVRQTPAPFGRQCIDTAGTAAQWRIMRQLSRLCVSFIRQVRRDWPCESRRAAATGSSLAE